MAIVSRFFSRKMAKWTSGLEYTMVAPFRTAPGDNALPRTPGALRVATLNVRVFFGGMKKVADFVVAATQGDLPDLLCLQEVTCLEPTDEFARTLGMSLVASAQSDYGLFNCILVLRGGLAVATHIQSLSMSFASCGGTETRAASLVRFEILQNGTVPRHIVLACTHLDHLSEDTRLAQLDVLLKEIDAYPTKDPKHTPPFTTVPRAVSRKVSSAEGGVSAAHRAEISAQLRQTALAGYNAAVKTLTARRRGEGEGEGEGGTQKEEGTPVVGDDVPTIDGWMIAGDLNSLTHSDYSEAELADVIMRRERAGVSPADYRVASTLRESGCVDTMSLVDDAARPIPLATSVYGVRVDYVLASQSLLDVMPSTQNVTLQHVQPTQRETDHCLVLADFPLHAKPIPSEGSSPPPKKKREF